MNRVEKQEFVDSLHAAFGTAEMVVVSRNNGLTVAESSDLRRRVRAAGAMYRVAKNRLAARALVGTRFSGLTPLLKGPTAFAWSKDPAAVAKVVVAFSKTNERFLVTGGALGEKGLDGAEIAALAELPSLDALHAKLARLLATPAQRLASILAEPGAGVARLLVARTKAEPAKSNP